MAIRFAPIGKIWMAEFRTTSVPDQALEPARFTRSPASGYGAVLLRTRNQMIANEDAAAIYQRQFSLLSHVNLLRILPGEEFSFDSWYLQRTGEDPADLAFVSAEEYLRYIRNQLAGFMSDPPADFDAAALIRHPLPQVWNLCLSPDGRYALMAVCVNNEDWDRLFVLVRLETMEIRPVEAPEGLINETLMVNSVFSRSAGPGMTWNPDGTLLIWNQESGQFETFRLDVR